jgi:hypothetical protein
MVTWVCNVGHVPPGQLLHPGLAVLQHSVRRLPWSILQIANVNFLISLKTFQFFFIGYEIEYCAPGSVTDPEDFLGPTKKVRFDPKHSRHDTEKLTLKNSIP